MKFAVLAFPFVALALLVACPPPTHQGPPTYPPGQPAPGTGHVTPAAGIDAGQAAVSGLGADGDACDVSADCAGGVCEGQGCGAGMGVCASMDRMCTQDMAQYCGCDGADFNGSGSCPGKRYSRRGSCNAKRADGAACATADQCTSGVCEGEGCGDEMGVCAPASRGCTKDLRAYCGCDGQTFRTSGSCPGQRFSRRGECS